MQENTNTIWVCCLVSSLGYKILNRIYLKTELIDRLTMNFDLLFPIPLSFEMIKYLYWIFLFRIFTKYSLFQIIFTINTYWEKRLYLVHVQVAFSTLLNDPIVILRIFRNDSSDQNIRWSVGTYKHPIPFSTILVGRFDNLILDNWYKSTFIWMLTHFFVLKEKNQ